MGSNSRWRRLPERSTDRIAGEARDGAGDYAFADTVRCTRDGYADKQVVRDPAAEGPRAPGVSADD